MKFFIEKNKEAGHRVTIYISKKIVNNAIFTELIKINKTTNINGFRKGKIPIKIIEKKYGDSIYYDVFKQLMQKFFHTFLQEEKIKIVGIPQYHLHENKDKKKEYFEFSVVYELYPKIQMKDLNLIKAKKIIVNITDEDIKKKIEENQTKKDIWYSVNQPIKYHDCVTIDYSIYEKNKKIDKFTIKNLKFIVYNNTLIPQLDNKIINHVVNDIIFFKIRFHSFHPEKTLQNKDIVFKIKVKKIEKKQEIETSIKKDNQEKKTTELDYLSIKNNISIQINQITQEYLEEQIAQDIVKKNLILVPRILLQSEIKNLYKKYKKQYKEKNHNILEKKYHINFNLKAKKRICFQMIIEKMISKNKLFVDEKNINQLIKEISLNYKKPIEIFNLYNKNKNLQNAIRNIELKRQAINFLEKEINIIKEYWTLDKFINYRWNNDEELFFDVC